MKYLALFVHRIRINVKNQLRLLALIVLIGTAQNCAEVPKPNAQKPNVIIIYADDVGYNDLGVYGTDKIPTPNLDALAKGGMMMTAAYATASTCTPSRYTLLTGEYAFRNKRAQILDGDAPLLIDPDRPTLADIFKNEGYTTAIFGKWHLGLANGEIDWNGIIKPGPLELGFDESVIVPTTVDRVPTVYVKGYEVEGLNPDEEPLQVSYSANFTDQVSGISNPELLRYPADDQHAGSIVNNISRIGWQKGGKSAYWDDEQMTKKMVELGNDFIQRNKENPFFLLLPMHQNHVPRIPNKQFVGSSEIGLRGDHVVELDWAVGKVVAQLEALGIRENTMIIFSSDNGPIYDDGYLDGSIKDANGHKANGPFRGGKYTTYEGATRLPFIVNWPGVVPEAKVSKAAFSQVDVLASMAELVGTGLPEGAGNDSIEFLSVMLGTSDRGRPYILQQGAGENYFGLRMGDWKLIPATNPPAFADMKHNKRKNPISTPMPEKGIDYLFNLAEDPSESVNRAAEFPEKVKEMKEILMRIKTSNDRDVMKSLDN